MSNDSIVQNVIDVFRGAGFEVRDELGAGHPFVVCGTLDSAAILLETVLTTEINRAPSSAPTAGSIDTDEFSELLSIFCVAGKELDEATGHDVFDAADNFTAARSALIAHIDTWAGRSAGKKESGD